MKILITRAEPAASLTAKKLESLGHEVVKLPLFKVTDTGNQFADKGFDGIIFTSQNAVETLKTRGWQPEDTSVAVFCVGQKTEKAARVLGFENIRSTDGGGARLAELIGSLNLKDSKFLYPTTADRSFDMEQALVHQGVTVKTIDIYQVGTVTHPADVVRKTIGETINGCALLYSTRSSKYFAEILEGLNLEAILDKIKLIGISKQAVTPLEHFKWNEVLVADKPGEAAMFDLINQAQG